MNDRTRFFLALAAQLLVAVPALSPVAFGAEPAASDKFDILIKGGTLYDGTGEKPRVTDVALLIFRLLLHLRVERTHRPAFAEYFERDTLPDVALRTRIMKE